MRSWRRGGIPFVLLTLAGCVPAEEPTPTATHAGAEKPAVTGAGTTRVYYIAADEIAWNYAPGGTNKISGEPFGETEGVFVEPGNGRIGSAYAKSVFREYTNEGFTELKPRPPSWEHLGLLGPVIHAEVGDTIKVVFKNNTRFPASLHAHGVQYDKASEGAPYADGTSGGDTSDDAVAIGETYTYQWKVPERAGPGPADPSSVMWMYHSHVDEVADMYAGLMGPIIVTRAGMARPDGTPQDVDRELVTNFMVVDENASRWLDENIARYVDDPSSVEKEDEGFQESNLMHGINGYVYGNQPRLTAKAGERVRWYLMGMGTEVDLHTPHWHGNTVLAMGMRTDVVSLLPASMVVADMMPDTPGSWLYHCHVADHISAGMASLYVIE